MQCRKLSNPVQLLSTDFWQKSTRRSVLRIITHDLLRMLLRAWILSHIFRGWFLTHMPHHVLTHTHQPARPSFSSTPQLARVQKGKLSGRRTHSINKNSVKRWCSVSLTVGKHQTKRLLPTACFLSKSTRDFVNWAVEFGVATLGTMTFSQLRQCRPSSSKNVIFRFASELKIVLPFTFLQPLTARRLKDELYPALSCSAIAGWSSSSSRLGHNRAQHTQGVWRPLEFSDSGECAESWKTP